jgi:hypothetical protein
MSTVPQTAWLVDMDLVFPVGSNKIKLTSQRSLVCIVLHEVIELLRAAMLFNNAFPDVCGALGMIKDCLFAAAKHLKPGTAEILKCLTQDAEYMSKITSVVRLEVVQCAFTDKTSQPCAQICLIQSEVKECCTVITMSSFLAFGLPMDIIDYIGTQLSHYTYTFPKAKLICHINVSDSL